MSLVKFLPAWFHAIADYAVGILLIVVALIVSMLTKYPLGVFKVLPFTIHSAGDYLAAALLIVAPFALNFADGESGMAVFYVVMGVAVLAVSLITNYQYSPKRDLAAGGSQPATA